MDYSSYQHLLFDRRPNGVLLVTINRPEVMNATNARLHRELAQVWRTIDEDPAVKIVIITGAGEAFSAGGDVSLLDDMTRDPVSATNIIKEVADIVYNVTNLDKPIISAINGFAGGAGLAVALMADISIMSETAQFTDGHVLIGDSAGDHSAIIWPLLCGLAKAKYYLLTGDLIDGKEAERIGLVSLCAPPDKLMDKAFQVADRLAAGSQLAIRLTKRSLNNWIRQAGPIFDNSLALEMLCFLNPDARVGVAALRGGVEAFLQKWPPDFPSAQ